MWYWYHVAGRSTTNKYAAKVLQVLGLVTGRPQASVVAEATDTGDDAGPARLVLGEFLAAMRAPLASLADGRNGNPLGSSMSYWIGIIPGSGPLAAI